MSKILIAIPTYQRPDGLRQVLQSIAVLETRHEVVVLVVNNDYSGKSQLEFSIQQLRDTGYRFPLLLRHEDRRGISHARNMIVCEALKSIDTDVLVMIDDDEFPSAQWLDELIDTQSELAADIVGGPVSRIFEDSRIPDYLRRYNDGKHMSVKREKIEFIGSTANILIDMRFLRRFPNERFDVEFGMTGGGDYEFLKRAKKLGASFAWAPQALIQETFPISRSSVEWSLKRAYRSANAEARVAIKHRQLSGVAMMLVGGFAGLIAGKVKGGRASSPPAIFRARVMEMRALGKLDAFRGRKYEEYAIVHGQ
ncbi:glycosyltransferase family 2 protein [Sphingobium yanoikuyae]|uniref:glycosyltransferase family 2 protein n=1 Tax=Sphingobium yanoikuyae TaxID=13690 RepID=UPI00293D06A8|nr:glycosyltransferase [Sphingobium yanoikuyae]MDV3482258.1 glycosyltransferase [Sphingobium yanoikuyae]